ncbi:hypothetical protein ACJX0J_023320, partial [Zea mays]
RVRTSSGTLATGLAFRTGVGLKFLSSMMQAFQFQSKCNCRSQYSTADIFQELYMSLFSNFHNQVKNTDHTLHTFTLLKVVGAIKERERQALYQIQRITPGIAAAAPSSFRYKEKHNFPIQRVSLLHTASFTGKHDRQFNIS